MHKLSEWEKNAQDVTNTVQRAAINCMSEPFNGCALPNTTLPTFVMPDRKQISQKDMKCSSARYYELNTGRITEANYYDYVQKDLAPKYVEKGKPSSGVEGWAKCSIVYRYL